MALTMTPSAAGGMGHCKSRDKCTLTKSAHPTVAISHVPGALSYTRVTESRPCPQEMRVWRENGAPGGAGSQVPPVP